ncbi:hypothetical protein B296_00002870 [Ensete ventricosum]|uniref:Uncharacterized protein n=1 Tax=Ensete ventricosum TaxID=4639 RepID=A0A426YZG4_ENSVE|nr:hypothetical protein B296_00002870 [Ensete ventricosum]
MKGSCISWAVTHSLCIGRGSWDSFFIRGLVASTVYIPVLMNISFSAWKMYTRPSYPVRYPVASPVVGYVSSVEIVTSSRVCLSAQLSPLAKLYEFCSQQFTITYGPAERGSPCLVRESTPMLGAGSNSFLSTTDMQTQD